MRDVNRFLPRTGCCRLGAAGRLASRTRVCASPAATSTTLLSVDEIADWFCKLLPQAIAVPSALRAMVCPPPPAAATTFARPDGVSHWPYELSPHANSVPLDR